MVLPCTLRGFLDQISPDETTTRHAVVAVDHYLNVVCPSGGSIHEILNVSNTTPELLLEFLSHQHYLHILTATLLFLINRMRPADTASFPILLSHLGLAMKYLRQNLLQTQQCGAILDDAAIMTIALLTVYAQRLDHDNCSALHKEQLLQTIHSRGGLDASGFCARLKCTLMQMDAVWSMSYDPLECIDSDGNGDVPTLFPNVRPAYDPFYPSAPFDSHYESLVANLLLPFQRLASKGRILSEVLDLLARVTTRQQQRHLQPKPMTTEFRKYNDVREAVPCLFHSPCKSQRADTAETTGAYPDTAQLSRHIALALIIYCNHAFTAGSAARYTGVGYTDARKRLTRELQDVMPTRNWWDPEFDASVPRLQNNEDDDDESTVLLWIYLNLIDACRNVEGGMSRTGREYLEKLRWRYIGNAAGDVVAMARRCFSNREFEERIREYWRF